MIKIHGFCTATPADPARVMAHDAPLRHVLYGYPMSPPLADRECEWESGHP